jgi:hypothetical protein
MGMVRAFRLLDNYGIIMELLLNCFIGGIQGNKKAIA